MSEINWFSFFILCLGIVLGIMSSIMDLELMFTAGMLFGVGLATLGRITKGSGKK